MTQIEQTEAVIKASARKGDANRAIAHANHARDLARKLDAVKALESNINNTQVTLARITESEGCPVGHVNYLSKTSISQYGRIASEELDELRAKIHAILEGE